MYFPIAPSDPPNNVRGFILNSTSIKVNWTDSLETNGYVITYTNECVMKSAVSTRNETVLTDLSPMSTYTIMVYSYKDLPSINNTETILKFDGKYYYMYVIAYKSCTVISVPVPSPVTSLTVTSVSTTGITFSWTIPSDINNVTHYTISYTPSCTELSSGNETASVSPHQSNTTYSYTLTGLHSGMNYTITVRAGNVLGESALTSIEIDTTSSSGKYMYKSTLILKFLCLHRSYRCT